MNIRMHTSKGREHAFYIRAIRNARAGRPCWHVGITTNKYFWLDLSTNNWWNAYCMARILAQRLKTTVYMFKTAKSFHLITKKPLNKQEWANEYLWWLENFGAKDVCREYILCCLKYGKATIRVSRKNGNIPYFIGLVNYKSVKNLVSKVRA